MSFHQHFANSIHPTSLLRKKSSKPVERAWDDTVAGPFDPLRDSDLHHVSIPAFEPFAVTMPMPLQVK